MKIHVLSDLHLEFAGYALRPVDADVRVLAGDTSTKQKGLEFAIKNSAIPTIYIAGNHEYYGGALPRLTDKLRSAAEGSQVHFLENEQVILGNTRFLGCTLWTDFLLLGYERRELAIYEAQTQMNDYRQIRKSPDFCRLRPLHTRSVHLGSVFWLKQRLAESFAGTTVVITHHAPSSKSLDPHVPIDFLSAAYASDLEELIEASPIDVWIHGHTHYCVDYLLHGTRVVSNQRGYPDGTPAGFDDEFVISV